MKEFFAVDKALEVAEQIAEKKCWRIVAGRPAFRIKRAPIDLPGVNAQERTREKLMESLRIGAEDLLSAEIPLEPGAHMTTIEVPEPNWGAQS